MKNLFIFIGLVFAFPIITNAATFLITPSSGSYVSGDIVTLYLSVDPSGKTIYTSMLDAKFSPDTFEVISFTLNDSMLAMKQGGYDLTDNANGVLIKTGGYTGGISSITLFGTLTMRAKSNGVGTFAVNNTSKLLDENNIDRQEGVQLVSFNIANKIPVSVPDLEPQKSADIQVVTPLKKPVITTDDSKLVDVTEATSTQNDSSLIAKEATSTQLASVAEVGAVNDATFWVYQIIAMIVVFTLGYFVGGRRWS